MDGQAGKPHRRGEAILVHLPATAADAVQTVEIAYETPVAAPGWWGRLRLDPPQLAVRASSSEDPWPVPAADFEWAVQLPPGYRFTHNNGTVFPIDQGSYATRWRSSGVLRFARRRSKASGWLTMLPQEMRQVESTSERLPAVESEIDAETLDEAEPRQATSSEAGKELSLPTEQPSEKANAPTDSRPRGGKDWADLGGRGLPITLTIQGEQMLFRSLGGAPRLDLSVVDQNRLTSLSYGVSILAAVAGVALTRRRPRAKVIYVSGLVLTATLIPILSGTERSLGTAATQLYAVAMLLIAYYLVAGVIGGVARRFRGHERMVATALPPAVTATLVLIVTFLATGASPCVAEQPGATPPEQPVAEGPPPVVVRIEPPPRPVQVPTDAIVVPYDLAAEDPRASDQIFVPYDRYLELLKAADSEASDAPPVAYALAGSDYRVRLASGDQLVVEGSLAIDSYSDESLAVPLVMERAMLAEALVDGQPARLRLVLPASDAAGCWRPTS